MALDTGCDVREGSPAGPVVRGLGTDSGARHASPGGLRHPLRAEPKVAAAPLPSLQSHPVEPIEPGAAMMHILGSIVCFVRFSQIKAVWPMVVVMALTAIAVVTLGGEGHDGDGRGDYSI